MLLSRTQGARPVTLIANSVGTVVAFSCLLELHRRHTEWLQEEGLSWRCDAGGVPTERSSAAHVSRKGRLLARVFEVAGVSSRKQPTNMFVQLKLGTGLRRAKQSTKALSGFSFVDFDGELLDLACDHPESIRSDDGKVYLHVEVWNLKTFKDELLASTKIAISEFVRNQGEIFSKTLPLDINSEHAAKTSGATIRMSILFESHTGLLNGAAGIVENVILMGATIPKSLDDWGKARRVVSGRFVNCYSSNDWVLSLIFRYQTFALSAAGLSAVTLRASDAVFGIVENRDMSHLISRHGDYSIQSKTILLELGFGTDVTPLGI